MRNPRPLPLIIVPVIFKPLDWHEEGPTLQESTIIEVYNLNKSYWESLAQCSLQDVCKFNIISLEVSAMHKVVAEKHRK